MPRLQVDDLKNNRVRSFFLYSNIHIPFLALALLSSTSALLEIEFSWALTIVAGSGAFLIYQIDRVWLSSPEDLINQPDRIEWYQTHLFYNYGSTTLAVLSGALGIFFLQSATVFSGFLLGLVGLTYLLPFGNNFKRLKGIWILKPTLIAVCWSYGVVFLPAIEDGGRIDAMIWSFGGYRGLLIWANVLLADLPDKRGDDNTELVTLATLLTEKKLIALVLSISALSCIVGLFHGMKYNWSLILFIDLFGAILVAILAIYASKKDKTKSHFLLSFMGDLVIAWPIMSVLVYLLSGGRI